MKSKVLANQKIIRRYQYRSWYLLVILIFICAAAIVFATKPKVISPCASTGCEMATVYVTKNLTIQEQVLIAGVREFGLDNAQSLLNIVTRESNFHPGATNSVSGACGLFQFFPCSKLKCHLGDIDCQVEEGLKYIRVRYGTPNEAWKFWQEKGWY
jgi:hypothetical protein